MCDLYRMYHWHIQVVSASIIFIGPDYHSSGHSVLACWGGNQQAPPRATQHTTLLHHWGQPPGPVTSFGRQLEIWRIRAYSSCQARETQLENESLVPPKGMRYVHTVTQHSPEGRRLKQLPR